MPGLKPTIRRHTVNFTDFRRIQSILQAEKFAIIADSTNTVSVNIASKEITNTNTEDYHELQPGDSLVWEGTKPGDVLEMVLWARVASGSAILFVWVWTQEVKGR